MRVRTMRALAIGVMVALVVPLAPSGAGAITAGNGAGCTPGFWKNHTRNWQEYAPSDPISELGIDLGAFSHLGSETLITALGWGGGSTLEDAVKNLLKHTVTAFLNAAHEDLQYPYRRGTTGVNGEPPLRTLVGDAIATGDRNEILRVKDILDDVNNADCRVKDPKNNKKKKRKGGKGKKANRRR